MVNIESDFKKWGLKRSEKGVGKKIDKNIWFHKKYINDFMTNEMFNYYIKDIPKSFSFDIIRYNEKEKELMLIKTKDFNSSHEPIIEDSYKISIINSVKINYKKSTLENPLIYHHKWLFVKDDYKGFDVSESKKRSHEWKSVLGVNKELSVKIGRKLFWDNWLIENNLVKRVGSKMSELDNKKEIQNFIEKKSKEKTVVEKDIWDIYLENKIIQSESSAKTARLQSPRSIKLIEEFGINKDYKKLLDIGCGSGNSINKEAIESMGMSYEGCDPFNKSKVENLKALKSRWGEQTDVVTLNNVLNTIPEENARKSVLRQAKDAMRVDKGLLLIIVYEGEKTKEERNVEKDTGAKIKNLTPIKTRDGWQNRMKAEDYLTEIKDVFPNTILVSKNGSKMLVSSKDLDFDLKSKFNKKKKREFKF